MIELIITLGYGLIILTYILTSLFIVYHIVSYSLNSSFQAISLIIFILVATGLLISNLILFSSIDWNRIFLNLIPS
jgi:hypothetical protein